MARPCDAPGKRLIDRTGPSSSLAAVAAAADDVGRARAQVMKGGLASAHMKGEWSGEGRRRAPGAGTRLIESISQLGERLCSEYQSACCAQHHFPPWAPVFASRLALLPGAARY